MTAPVTPAAAPAVAVVCPIPRCRTHNDAAAESCGRCGTPLRAYVRLGAHTARLFNDGLAAARDGDFAAARDRFAAIVHWCPHDAEARSALGLACYELGDTAEARRQWQQTAARRPQDRTARAGLALLDTADMSAAVADPPDEGVASADPPRPAAPE
ncbi:tetratricopeptide repeat protein [Streptomyces sp. HUAS MG91]|uniref:Tetratricopeptide repeat protein n=1 Tax=Streptomyces tabacisoli TaxID=3156398 RepID=A0AAU8IWJ0_9ACTN